MAFLDPQDVIERLYSLLPQGWFPDLEDAPNVTAVLSMIGSVYSNDLETGLYQFLQYAQQQSRVHTATDFWLDMIAEDFFGSSISRHNSETDDSFRRRIIVNLLAPRATRCALNANLQNLTGFPPEIIELRNTGDCGSYTSLDNPIWGGAAYNEAGHYGTMRMPYQLLVNAFRPLGQGIPNVNGYSCSGGGYATYPKPYGYVGGLRPQNFGTGEYVLLSQIIDHVTDRDIYDTVAKTMPVGTTAWTSIADTPEEMVSQTGDMLDVNFYFDLSTLAPDDLPVPGGAIGQLTMRLFSNGQISHGDGQALLRMVMKIPGAMFQGAPYTFSGNWQLILNIAASALNARSNLRLQMQIKGNLQAKAQPVLGTFIVTTDKLGLLNAITLASTGASATVGTLMTSKQLTPTLIGSQATGQLTAPTTSIVNLITPSVTASSVSSAVQAGQPTIQGANDASLNLGSVATIVQSGAPTVRYTGQIQLSGVPTTALIGQVLTNRQSNIQMPAGVRSTTGVGTVRTEQDFSFQGVSTVVEPTNITITATIQQSITATGAVGTMVAIPGSALPLGQSSVSSFTLGQAGSATPLGQPAAAQQWSAVHKSGNIALSNSNLTATSTVAGENSVFTTLESVSGKYYWEVVITSSQMGNVAAGIGNINAGVAATQFVGIDPNGLGWIGGSGALMCNDSALALTLPTYASGDTLSFALDIDDGVMWVRKNAGSWTGGVASADPGTPSTGIAIPSTVIASVGGGIKSAIGPGVTINQVGDTAVGHFTQASWTQTAPTGYSPWITAQVTPLAPTNLVFSSVNSSGFTLDWTPSQAATAPTNLQTTSVGSTTITFTWTAST